MHTRKRVECLLNYEDLEIFVTENSHKILREIGQHFGVSAWAINKRLKRLGFSYNKKPSPMWKQAKKSKHLKREGGVKKVRNSLVKGVVNIITGQILLLDW